ncbi:MAG: cardiolipin synthase [Bauldia sp.]|nr:cardiolipin synthase [Bauldia sp.]
MGAAGITTRLRALMLIALHVLVQIALIVRVLLRPHRDPASRVAWVAVILSLPVLGIITYLLFGETSIGRHRLERIRQVMAGLPDIATVPGYTALAARSEIPERHQPLFRVGQSISGFEPVGGNHAELMADSDAAIAAMVADIDAATRHIHLLFYIWLPDGNGTKMAEAIKRAAARGVACRVLVDDLGSRSLIRSKLWSEMADSGARLGQALRVGNPLKRILEGRIDIRNHRKILVVDNTITFCGSQNCADPEFLPKRKFAPWVDVMLRVTGPVVRQNQYVFAADWMTTTGEDIRGLLSEPLDQPSPGFSAQVITSGPTARHSAAPEMFEAVMYSARRELFVTTPYYVPLDAIQSALCAAANRGVDTTIIFPARNDDFAVGATSRSYYADLLEAGVKIHEYGAGLLHSKSMTVDGEVTLVGSANMDRRSFELNYENNILICDRAVTAQIRARQETYLADSRRISLEEVEAWPWTRRLWNNTLAVLGPLL